MATWGTRGLRGSTLEEMINMTNNQYRDAKLALVQKVPTPIKPMKIDKYNKRITLAYFEMKSTVDYIGVVQGIPICFDAKECSTMTYPVRNIHDHQYKFMKEFEEQGGLSFILMYFTKYDEVVYIPFKDIETFIKRARKGGRKSFKYEELDLNYTLNNRTTFMIHYLEMINKDIGGR